MAQTENKMGTMPEGKLLFSMSLPIMISMLVQALYNIVDSAFVARISEDALTAVSLAFPVQLLMVSVASGAGVGINALLSRRLGQQRHEEANAVAMNGVLLGVVFWLIFAAFGLFGSGLFIRAFTQDSGIAAMGTTYLRIVTTASIGIFLLFVGERIMQATGNTVFHMITQLFSALLNLLFDPILIFGLFGFPRLGVAGAAIATVFSQIVAMLIGFFINIRFNREVTLSLRGFRPDRAALTGILRIGLPAMLTQSLASVLTIALNALLMPITKTAVSFYGAYFKLQNFLCMPIIGMNNAMIPMVGYNFGAKHRRRIRKLLRYGVLTAVGIMLCGTVLFRLLPATLLALFDASPTMLALGVPAIRTIALCYPLMGASLILCGAMQGLGHSSEALLVALVRQILVMLPAAVLLSRLSLDALWYAFPLAELLGLLCAVLLYRSIAVRTLAALPD